MRTLIFILLPSAFILLPSGCVRDNGTASYNPITDAQYQEALTNEQTRAR